MDPTALLYLSFQTIEATTLKHRQIGFSIFPIFINSATKMPVMPADNIPIDNTEARLLHKGKYQLPIYCEFPQVTDFITYRNFIRLERIPNASVLIRVDYAAIDYDGNFISIKDPNPNIANLAYEAAPNYSDAIYSTTYFLTSDIEREVFDLRKVRSTDAPLKEVLEAIADVKGEEIDNDEDLLEFFRQLMADEETPQMID